MIKARNLVRYIIFTHRYLGIALSLLFVVWFASGIVMMYSGGMPYISPEERLARLPALNLTEVKLTPSAAAEMAGVQDAPTLTTVMSRPAYRFAGAVVFADTGAVLAPIDTKQAVAVVSQFTGQPAERIHYQRTLAGADQWTIYGGQEVGLLKFAVDDGAGTEAYVAPEDAEVLQLTTRKSRWLGWTGAVPHWLYFVALRSEHPPLWSKIVLWSSGLACLLAFLGLVLGYTQFRRSRPFTLGASIPYRGWMRWHYILGVLFGAFMITWAFSGLLSIEPFDWTRARGLSLDGEAFNGGPPQLERFGPIDPALVATVLSGRTLKAVKFARVQGEHYWIVESADGSQRSSILVSAQTQRPRAEPFSAESLRARLQSAAPGTAIADSRLLNEYDAYYYSRTEQLPLPVLRVKFSDPMQTWVYVDPQRGEILKQAHRLNRLERWLYTGLHNLDFSFWYSRRPLWDIGMLTLLLGGLASSVLGFYLSVRRLRRDWARAMEGFAKE